jgi:hypothetical protein
MNTELLRRYRTGDTDHNVGTFWLIARIGQPDLIGIWTASKPLYGA